MFSFSNICKTTLVTIALSYYFSDLSVSFFSALAAVTPSQRFCDTTTGLMSEPPVEITLSPISTDAPLQNMAQDNQESSVRIKELMILGESYTRYKENFAQGKILSTPNEAIAVWKNHYFDRSINKKWFTQTFNTFEQMVIKNQDEHMWIAKQLKNYGMIRAPENMQKSKVSTPHCVSFVYEFFIKKPNRKITDYKDNLAFRLSKLLEKVDAKANAGAPEIGDLIIYSKDNEITHVAIYLGLINEQAYAISKFGDKQAVYYHLVDKVHSDYGTPNFYSPLKKDKVIKKIETLQNDLSEKLYQHTDKIYSFFQDEPVVSNDGFSASSITPK